LATLRVEVPAAPVENYQVERDSASQVLRRELESRDRVHTLGPCLHARRLHDSFVGLQLDVSPFNVQQVILP
jgi:hypothetical protein